MTKRRNDQKVKGIPLKNMYLYRCLFCSVQSTGNLSTEKEIPQVFVNFFCWAEGLRSVSSPYLHEEVSEFQFYNWTYIFFSGGKNIDGLQSSQRARARLTVRKGITYLPTICL